MGTDFSYEDLRKENSKEYTFKRLYDQSLHGTECYVILSTPADSQKIAAKGFTNRMIFVEKNTYRIIKIEYYNGNQDLMKTLLAENYGSRKVNGDTERPHRAIMKNHSTGSESVMTLEKSRLNFIVDPNIFTVEGIQQWSPELTQGYLSIFNSKS